MTKLKTLTQSQKLFLPSYIKNKVKKYYINASGKKVYKLEKPVLAWFLCTKDRVLGYGDGRPIQQGVEHFVCHDYTRTHYSPHSWGRKSWKKRGQIALCKRGLHASFKLSDAKEYCVNHAFVCRVELSGWISIDTDKVCASRRKILWMIKTNGVNFSEEKILRKAQEKGYEKKIQRSTKNRSNSSSVRRSAKRTRLRSR